MAEPSTVARPYAEAAYRLANDASALAKWSGMIGALAQVADLAQRLEKRTGRKVRTQVKVDKDLIGGVKVVIGDKVIDGSARGQLSALETALKA